MATERELQFLDEVAGDMSAAERDALAGVNFFCVLRAVGRFVLCGPTNPECQRALVSDVLSCLGMGDGG